MINLAGYHFQGSKSRQDGKGSLVYPSGYQGSFSPIFADSFPFFLNGNKCFIGKIENGNRLAYGPLPFCFQIEELEPPSNWKSQITGVFDGTTTTQQEINAVHLYFVFCARGTNPAAEWRSIWDIDDPLFMSNFNPLDYTYGNNIFALRYYAAEYILSLKGEGQAVYKMNGKYAASGTKSGSIVDGLQKYTGGFYFIGESGDALGWKRRESGITPSIINPISSLIYPIPGPLNVNVRFHNGGVVPSIKTMQNLIIGERERTAGTLLIARNDPTFPDYSLPVSFAISADASNINVFERNPLQLESVFTGYDNTDITSPRFSYGFIITSEAIQ